MENFEKILEILQKVTIYLILILLSLDTIRVIIASMGVVKPGTKFARIVYGKYERNLIAAGLEELGFQPQMSEEISKNLRKAVKNEREINGVRADNAAEHLIALIAKYIVYFNEPISFGGTGNTNSSYYINTMEMAHNESDKQKMSAIMTFLYSSIGNTKKPELIVSPKGGNPLFAHAVANHYKANLIIAKSKKENSRVSVKSTLEDDPFTNFKINFEGSWNVLNSKAKQKCIIVDCNTSGGSQIIEILSDLKTIAKNVKEIKFEPPKEAYVLFRATTSGENFDINEKFKNNECSLYRFFDLDEEIKKEIYKFKKETDEKNRSPDIYFDTDKILIDSIIKKMQEKKVFYYKYPKKSESDMSVSHASKTQGN